MTSKNQTSRKKIENTTYPPKCHWCGAFGEVRFLKVSLKKEKPACMTCYEMMTVKPEIMQPGPINFGINILWRMFFRIYRPYRKQNKKIINRNL